MTRNLLATTIATAKLTAWSCFVFPTTAWAYVDPGSASVIVTAVLGFIGAVSYTMRKYFYRLRSAFRRKASARDKENAGA